jgi:hypothetical protein
VVARDGVPDEGHGLAADEAEEGGGVEPRELAAVGLPSPPEDGLHRRLADYFMQFCRPSISGHVALV